MGFSVDGDFQFKPVSVSVRSPKKCVSRWVFNLILLDDKAYNKGQSFRLNLVVFFF